MSRRKPVDAGAKVRPYEHLSDAELRDLVADAADLRLRLAVLSPGDVYQTLIQHGCPKRPAVNMVTNPQLRGFAARFHLDCEDAHAGDPEAKARVEHVMTGWERMRAQGRPETGAEAEERAAEAERLEAELAAEREQ